MRIPLLRYEGENHTKRRGHYSFKIQWDRNYGIAKRQGWSISLDGFYLVSLERWFIIAVVKALWSYMKGNR